MTSHGTVAGYSAHRRCGTRPCTDCCTARATYERERRATVVQTVRLEIPNLFVVNANRPMHWRVKADRVRWVRLLAYLHARDLKPMKAAHLLVELQFSDRRRRDPANYSPTLKAAIDGMATDAKILPDDDWRHLDGPDLRVSPDLCPRGFVVATFTYTEREVL